MRICDVFPLLKVGLFVKTNRDGVDFSGEIGAIETGCIFVFTNETKMGMPMRYDMLEKAIEKGYKNSVFLLGHMNTNIEILDKLPDEKPSLRVCDVFKLLKVGLFVKTYADAKVNKMDEPIIGEIGMINYDSILIFTNKIPEGYTGVIHETICNYGFKKELEKKGYKHAWVVFNTNPHTIEILDSLPDEEKPKTLHDKIHEIVESFKNEPEPYQANCSECINHPQYCNTRKKRIKETLKQLDDFVDENNKPFVFIKSLFPSDRAKLKIIANNLHSLLDVEIESWEDDEEDEVTK